MRLVPILTALLVAAALYLLVFERGRLMDFAGAPGAADSAEAGAGAGPEAAPAQRSGVSVVALRSEAREIDTAIVLRGRTEAARQVEVRAETSGKVISEPLRKGAAVEEGQVLCRIAPGTREVALSEAEARLAEARAAVPEAEARVAEAEAQLEEARINQNAASQLGEGGFASQTRVASAQAAIESARAAVQAARSGQQAASAGIRSAEAAVAAAETEIERLEITAPFAGLLESDTAELGALLQQGGLCATVIQLDPMKLVGFVPEASVGQVSVGARAGARLTTGERLEGEVTFLSRAADPTTRTFRTEIEVGNADLSVRDGQTAEIVIQTDGRSAHLLPQSALTLDDSGDLGVRTVTPEGTAGFAPVRIIRDAPEGVFVAGLPETASVIVVGQDYAGEGVALDVTWRKAGG